MSVRVVAIGAGWATGERHLPALLRDPRVEVLGVLDRRPERARELAHRYGLAGWGSSLDEGWAAAADCVTVGTPPWTHGALVGEALDRGLHCLCEKPFVLPATDAARLAAAARDRGLVLATVHNFQFSRAGSRLFELIARGEIGAVEAVYGVQLSNPRRRLPQWYRDLPGGLFVDEAPHLLYLMRRVLGTLEPRVVDARLHGTEIRDICATFAHGSVWATLVMSFNAPVSEWQLVVVGSESVAAIDMFRDLLVVVPNDGRHGARDVLRSSLALVGGHATGFVRSGVRMTRHRLDYGNGQIVARFVDAVTGARERIAGMTADDGLAVVTCLEELVRRAGIEPTLPTA